MECSIMLHFIRGFTVFKSTRLEVSSIYMMFAKLYFRTSDIYLISLVSLDPSGFHLRTKMG